MEIDGQIFRLQLELVGKSEADLTQKLGRLLKAREEVLLKMEREKEERLSNAKYKRA
jgi:hypothetical protein